MLLEGIKNLFIFGNVFGALNLLANALEEFIDLISTTGELPEHLRIEALLLPLKMSWQQEFQDFESLAENAPDDSDPAPYAQFYRWFGKCVHDVYLLFNNQPDPEAEYVFSNFLSNNDTVLAEDIIGNAVLIRPFTARYSKLMTYSAQWLLAVSGALLLCMAILNGLQRRPRNRFAWGYSFNRAIIGSIIILIGGATSKLYTVVYRVYLIIPIIALGYGGAAMADWVVLLFSIYSIRKKENFPSASNTNTKDNDDWGSVVNVRRFSERYYAQVASRQRSSMESLSSASGLHTTGRMYYTQGEVFDPYAEAGVPHYPTSYHHYAQGLGGSLSDSPTQTIFQRNHEEAIP